MKLLTIQSDGEDCACAMLGDEILKLSYAADFLDKELQADSVLKVLQSGDTTLEQIKRLLDSANTREDALREIGAIVVPDNVVYRPPIPQPGFILSVGMNYAEHLREMNTPIPNEPAAFVLLPITVLSIVPPRIVTEPISPIPLTYRFLNFSEEVPRSTSLVVTGTIAPS